MRSSDWSSDVCSSDLWKLDLRIQVPYPTLRFIAQPIPVELYVLRYAGGVSVKALSSNTGVDWLHVLKSRGDFDHSLADHDGHGRSEERRVGKECVSTCRSRWSPDH